MFLISLSEQQKTYLNRMEKIPGDKIKYMGSLTKNNARKLGLDLKDKQGLLGREMLVISQKDLPQENINNDGKLYIHERSNEGGSDARTVIVDRNYCPASLKEKGIT